jgi:hypothetical protein
MAGSNPPGPGAVGSPHAKNMQASEYSVPVPSDRTAILCLHCGKPQEVGRKAMSVTCKFCSKSLKLEDVKISRYEARRVIETCGTVTIDKKGHVVSDIRCVSLNLKGKLKGDVVSLGRVEVAGDAELKGDVTAASISIGPRAMMEGHYHIGPRTHGTTPTKPQVEEPATEVTREPADEVGEQRVEEPVKAPEVVKPVPVIKIPVRKTATITRHR